MSDITGRNLPFKFKMQMRKLRLARFSGLAKRGKQRSHFIQLQVKNRMLYGLELKLKAREAELAALRALQTNAARAVLAERRRQVEAEGWTPGHDDEHESGEMAEAAACYAACAETHSLKGHPPLSWPWSPEWWKPSADPRRNLVKAGALILAEIERLDRAAMERDA